MLRALATNVGCLKNTDVLLGSHSICIRRLNWLYSHVREQISGFNRLLSEQIRC